MSSALGGGFLTTEPPGKPSFVFVVVAVEVLSKYFKCFHNYSTLICRGCDPVKLYIEKQTADCI